MSTTKKLLIGIWLTAVIWLGYQFYWMTKEIEFWRYSADTHYRAGIDCNLKAEEANKKCQQGLEDCKRCCQQQALRVYKPGNP
jgi:hypothetical protein